MFKIGEFAEISGLSPKMLRHYQKLGLLRPALVDNFTQYRYYTLAQLEQIHQIHGLREVGFTLSEIRHLVTSHLGVDELQTVLLTKEQELQRKLDHLQGNLARLRQQLVELTQEEGMPNYEISLKDYIINEIVATVPIDAAAQISVEAEIEPGSLLIQIGAETHAELMVCTLHHNQRNRLIYAFRALHRWIETNAYLVTEPPRIISLSADPPVFEVQIPVRKR
jgi:DNA-binding transcriptional MerR regulator